MEREKNVRIDHSGGYLDTTMRVPSRVHQEKLIMIDCGAVGRVCKNDGPKKDKLGAAAADILMKLNG